MKETNKGKDPNALDVNNDRLMVMSGLRPPMIIKHPELFKKTTNEKKVIKRIKSNHKAMLMASGFNPKKRMNMSEPIISKI